MIKNQQYTVSSLEKIFPDKAPKLKQSEYSVFQGETFYFQVACYSVELVENIEVTLSSPIAEFVSVRVVENVPSAFAVWKERSDGYTIKGRGNNELYPELLREVHRGGGEDFRPRAWKAFWITVEGELPVGKYEITLRVRGTGAYEKLYDESSTFFLTVLDERLPEVDFTYTTWVHYDCIAQIHGVKPFDEEFYRIVEKYIHSAAKSGVNMLYLPLFTATTDVRRGKYRPTLQAVKITVDENGTYRFDFSNVRRLMEMGLRFGMKRFECSHLATQWGAASAPKIVADIDGEEKQIFGWDTVLPNEEYGKFLDEFLQAFALFLEEKGWTNRVYFHISDEPHEEAVLSRFSFVKEKLLTHFPNGKIMDTLSNRVLYEKGIVNCPVVSLDAYKNIPVDWVYYCGCVRKEYITNRHFAMPLQRTRIFGSQAYLNNIKGFLHWGFNYYYGGLSEYLINPYFITDRGGCTESGDCFLVYPAKDGVNESIRQTALFEGIQDMKALYLLEKYIGKENVRSFLKKNGFKEGFSVYPKSEKKYLKLRAKINAMIMLEKERV